MYEDPTRYIAVFNLIFYTADAEPWIRHESTVFQASGLHASNIRVNEYEGPPSEAINSRWNALWDGEALITSSFI